MTEEIKNRIKSIRKGEIPKGYRYTKDIGIAPDDWNLGKMSDVIKNVSRPVPKPDKPYWRLGIKSWAKGTFHAFVDDPETVDMDELYEVKENDLIVNITFAWEHAIAIAKKEDEGLLVSHRFPTYVFKDGQIPKYYQAVISQQYFKNMLDHISPGGAGRNRVLNRKDFLNLPCYIPSLAEQQKISEILSSCDTVIQKYENKKSSLLQLKKYLLSKMFPSNNSDTPEIRFDEFTTAWEIHKFGEMFKRRMERNNGQFDKTRWISVAQMYFQEPDKVTSNNIDTRTYVMRKGDIAFEGHNNQDHKYGRFVENDIGDGVISELFPIYEHKGEYDLNYWKYAIQIEEIMAPKLLRCIEISYTSSNKLDEKFFLNEEIAVPSILEQKRIGELFKEIDNLINLYTQMLDELRQQKNFLSAVLLTGIVRV